MTAWESYLEEHASRHMDELVDFLRIPSVSALPDHAGDVRRAAEWVAARLTTAGAEHARVLPTAGHPVVYADYLHAPGKPTVLIYGHFDVQPVDPVSLWTTPPFEPQVRDGRIYARGASDDKGNMLAPILAVEALLRSEGGVPVNLKFFLEGQEEIGSPDVPPFLRKQRDLFACDMVLSADGGQFGEDMPSLCLACRGLCTVQIDVQGAKQDLHSGIFGGAVANPIAALVQILASLRDEGGRILVPGFYDKVVELTDAERKALAEVPFDEQEFMAGLEIDALPGEPGYTPMERRWVRPTLEFSGIWGGFQGDGVKTVLPGEAHAKITSRLVPNQEPSEIVQLIAEHIRRQRVPGVKIGVQMPVNQARPYAIAADHWGNVVAARVLTQIYGTTPLLTRSGGSIPVCELFLNILGAPTVEFGFGLDDENFHAPNEFLRLASFERAKRAYGLILHELGSASPAG